MLGLSIGFFSGFASKGWAMGWKRREDMKSVCKKLGVPIKDYERFIKKLSLETGEELVRVLMARGKEKKDEVP